MGKGDDRRPTLVSDRVFTNNWCATMGHKTRPGSQVCINCGTRVVKPKGKPKA